MFYTNNRIKTAQKTENVYTVKITILNTHHRQLAYISIAALSEPPLTLVFKNTEISLAALF